MESPFRQQTPRERRRDRTRERLFEAAIEEFRREGFDRASIAQIAKRAGVSRASFYFHFPTKEHVLLELQWSLEQRVVEHLKGRNTLRAALEEFIDAMIEAEDSVGDPGLYRDMLRIYARRPADLPLEDQPFPLVFELGKRFAKGAQNAELREGLEPAQATHLFLTSVFGYLVGSDVPQASRRSDLEVLISLYLREDPS
jgi:TetR/AcrR family transcriptional repressor of uid operon